jgi:hypothetical protein
MATAPTLLTIRRAVIEANVSEAAIREALLSGRLTRVLDKRIGDYLVADDEKFNRFVNAHWVGAPAKVRERFRVRTSGPGNDR